MRKRICVIGAGVAGLASLRHLTTAEAIADEIQVVAFEQRSEIGGIWIYTVDNSGPEPNPMYRDMRTNLPKEIMCYPDFPYSGGAAATGDDSFLHHSTVLQYLQEYSCHFGLQKFIQFRKRVQLVHPVFGNPGSDRLPKWKVTVADLDNPTSPAQIYDFDFVLVCNGHFCKPHLPTIPGLESFKGQVLHSRAYRSSDEYAGRTVLIVGSKFSAIDIALEITRVAKRVVMSIRSGEPISCQLGVNVSQIGVIDRVSESGTGFVCRKLRTGARGEEEEAETGQVIIEADAIIFCTGYEYDSPFLSPACETRIHTEGQYVTPLYKDVIHAKYPSLWFLALQQRIIPFIMVDVQVRYFLAFLEGKFQIPNTTPSVPGPLSHILGPLQWPYYEELADEGGLDPEGSLYPCIFGSFVVPERRISLQERGAFIKRMAAAVDQRRVEVPALFKSDRFELLVNERQELDFDFIKYEECTSSSSTVL